MGNPGLFLGLIKMDGKTNNTHGFEYFTCNLVRDPHFRKIYMELNQLDHGPKSMFTPIGCGNVLPRLHPVLFGKISYNILPLVQVLVRVDAEAKKVDGGVQWRGMTTQ